MLFILDTWKNAKKPHCPSILISVECPTIHISPSGCHQYYTASSGQLESFNFPQGLMLGVIGNTNYCFKQAKGEFLLELSLQTQLIALRFLTVTNTENV